MIVWYLVACLNAGTVCGEFLDIQMGSAEACSKALVELVEERDVTWARCVGRMGA